MICSVRRHDSSLIFGGLMGDCVGTLRILPAFMKPRPVHVSFMLRKSARHWCVELRGCSCSMFLRQVGQCFPAVWTAGFPQCWRCVDRWLVEGRRRTAEPVYSRVVTPS